jgi:hypothetical protein
MKKDIAFNTESIKAAEIIMTNLSHGSVMVYDEPAVHRDRGYSPFHQKVF